MCRSSLCDRRAVQRLSERHARALLRAECAPCRAEALVRALHAARAAVAVAQVHVLYLPARRAERPLVEEAHEVLVARVRLDAVLDRPLCAAAVAAVAVGAQDGDRHGEGADEGPLLVVELLGERNSFGLLQLRRAPARDHRHGGGAALTRSLDVLEAALASKRTTASPSFGDSGRRAQASGPLGKTPCAHQQVKSNLVSMVQACNRLDL